MLSLPEPLFYLAMAVCAAVIVWHNTPTTPVFGDPRSYTARRLVLTAAAGAFWPGAVLGAAAYQFPAGRKIINALIGVPARDDGHR